MPINTLSKIAKLQQAAAASTTRARFQPKHVRDGVHQQDRPSPPAPPDRTVRRLRGDHERRLGLPRSARRWIVQCALARGARDLVIPTSPIRDVHTVVHPLSHRMERRHVPDGMVDASIDQKLAATANSRRLRTARRGPRKVSIWPRGVEGRPLMDQAITVIARHIKNFGEVRNSASAGRVKPIGAGRRIGGSPVPGCS
ncbi:hypothetical protein HU200_064960 [Digitaria exilis]|uniref:Uncharacterized protein n=1 Tax=Digitaria exilis TaxID=1010633 RepID=A0A835A4T2_9POAL|nr:hypothetical protein HU200_064960 [Digitaria exilis]